MGCYRVGLASMPSMGFDCSVLSAPTQAAFAKAAEDGSTRSVSADTCASSASSTSSTSSTSRVSSTEVKVREPLG